MKTKYIQPLPRQTRIHKQVKQYSCALPTDFQDKLFSIPTSLAHDFGKLRMVLSDTNLIEKKKPTQNTHTHKHNFIVDHGAIFIVGKIPLNLPCGGNYRRSNYCWLMSRNNNRESVIRKQNNAFTLADEGALSLVWNPNSNLSSGDHFTHD